MLGSNERIICLTDSRMLDFYHMGSKKQDTSSFDCATKSLTVHYDTAKKALFSPGWEGQIRLIKKVKLEA